MPAARARSTLARALAHTLASAAGRAPASGCCAGGNGKNRVREGRRPDGGNPAPLHGSTRLASRGAPDHLTRLMDCYLVQHGEAKPEQEDPARPLSDRGRRDVERVAQAAQRSEVAVAAIFHSGKLRAQQTADLLAAALSPVGGVRAVAGLAPLDDPAAARELLDQAAAPRMLVGHLPHLSRLTSLLLRSEEHTSELQSPCNLVCRLLL